VEGGGFGVREIEADRGRRRGKSRSIAGGSHETLTNIIANRILGVADLAESLEGGVT